MKRGVSTGFVIFALCVAGLAMPAGAALGASAPGPPIERRVFSPSDLLTGVLKNLISSAGKKAFEKGLKGSESLGWLLAAFGLEGVLGGEDELAPIREKLDELTKQVGDIRREIKHRDLEEKINSTHEVTSHIDDAFRDLDRLAKLPSDDPTRANFAREIAAEIGRNLTSAPTYFDKVLGSNVPQSSNLIKSASRVVHADHRFFDRKSSAEIRDVYEYFATYEVKLAVLLAEYFHTRPDTYAPSVIESKIKDIQQNIESQEKLLKPPVPENTVIDTKTNLMWLTDGRQAEKRPTLLDYIGVANVDKKGATWPNGQIHYTIAEQANNASPWDVPWGGRWKLPTIGDFQTLISDRGNAAPISFLVDEAHFNRAYLQAADSRFWTNPSDWHLVPNFVYYKLFNLRTGEVAKTDSLPFLPGKWRETFGKIGSVAIYNRRPDAGEEYWWK